MDDQTTWKGHTFTLLVFTGIVVLCSIFFILGMLVGRMQGQKIASVGPATGASVKSDAKVSKDDKPDYTFYDSIKRGDSAALVPAPQKPAPDPEPVEAQPKKRSAVVDAKPAASPVSASTRQEPSPVPPPTANMINWQIGIFSKSGNAQKVLDAVRKKGFRAFILAPSEGDPSPIFRVQVGPFADSVAAEAAKKKLETAGYTPILKK